MEEEKLDVSSNNDEKNTSDAVEDNKNEVTDKKEVTEVVEDNKNEVTDKKEVSEIVEDNKNEVTDKISENNTLPNNEEKEVSKVEESKTIEEQNQTSENKAKLDELKAIIDNHFNVVRNQLKFIKEKDFNIIKLSNNLTQYRDGIDNVLFKTLAKSLINFRELLKKCIKDNSSIEVDSTRIKKNIDFLIYDYEDLLNELNVVVNENEVLYNGFNIDNKIDFKIEKINQEEYTLPPVENVEINDLNDLVPYIKNIEEYTISVLKNNSIQDNTISKFIENSILYEKGIHQVILHPIIWKIVDSYKKIKERINKENNNINQENIKEFYLDCVNAVLKDIDNILESCEVTIDSCDFEVYNPQLQKAIKTINCDIPEKNGIIVDRFSDCYFLNGKVIYQQKVSIYRFIKK